MMCFTDYLLIFCWTAGFVSGIGVHYIYSDYKRND